jgi:hypothetical protein
MVLRDSLWDRLGEHLSDMVMQLLSPADLLALCLVSKASRSAAEPFLYSKIEWTWLDDQPPPIAAFLRTILRRPELAAYVRSVALVGDNLFIWRSGTYMTYRKEYVLLIPILGWDLNDAVEAIEMTGVPYTHRWGQKLRRGTIDAFVALLLSQLHQLRHLVLGPNFTRQAELLGMFLNSALCRKGDYRLPTFQYLQAVTYELVDEVSPRMYGRYTADVLPFFYLPEVQHLSVSLDNPATLNWPMNMPPDPSKITSLTLDLIRETHLSRLLSATPGLKTLRWGWFHSSGYRHEANMPLVDLTKAGAALIHVRNTLKELTISAIHDWGDYIDSPLLDIKGSLKVLVDFCQLEKLEIPLHFLVASFIPATGIQLKDVVPRHIQWLIINDNLEDQEEQNKWDDKALYNAIALWLQNSSVPKPNLRTISLLLNQTKVYWGPRMRQALTELCDQCGFEAKITKVKEDREDRGYVTDDSE